jgi:hypothetical protein
VVQPMNGHSNLPINLVTTAVEAAVAVHKSS